MTDIISEHEAPPQENKGQSHYEPTPEEVKACKLVAKLFEKAKKHRSLYDEKWISNYQMFRGKQWKEARPSYRHAEVVNMIFQSIQSTVPIQTDQRPRFTFVPQEPNDREFAEILNDVAENDWVRQNWNEELTEIIYDSNFYSVGLCETGYDGDALDGVGQITFLSQDPFYFFPDPSARDVNKDCDYVVIAEPKDISKIKKLAKKLGADDKVEFIRSDVVDMMSSGKTDLLPNRLRSPTDSRLIVDDAASPNELAYQDKAMLFTCYLKCDDYEETQTEDGSYEQKLKYPNGRKIVKVNEMTLYDGPIPYDDGLFPFARLVNYTLPREFWGISEIEQLEGPQKIFNKLLSFALDVLTLMGNPVWLNPTSSDVDSEGLTNRPGLVIDHNPGFAPQRIEGVQLQPYVMQLAQDMRVWFNEISGSNDITRGVQPTGVTAAAAISSLQDAAQTRLRLKARHLDSMLQDAGKQYLSRVFQFYSAPRMFRITAKDGTEKYFKMHITKDEKTGKRVAEYVTAEGQRKQYIIEGEFDVRVMTGSTLPFAKAEKEQRLMNLLQAGIIDGEEVLKGLDYPNWQSVLERIAAKNAEAAAAQQQQAAMPA